MAASAPPCGGGLDEKQWRAALLTIRDEFAATSPDQHSAAALLRRLLLPYPATDLAAAASLLPPQEVAADVVLLVETAGACAEADDVLFGIFCLVHEIFIIGNIVIISSSSPSVLNFLQIVVECFQNGSCYKRLQTRKVAASTVTQCLEILRLMSKSYGRHAHLLENIQLIKILMSILLSLRSEIFSSHLCSKVCSSACDIEFRNSESLYSRLWDIFTSAFSLVEGGLRRAGASISTEVWKSAVESLRKVLENSTTKIFLAEDNVMSRFYISVLRCLHLVLSNPKEALNSHAAGFVATLQIFFMYGLRSSASIATNGFTESRSEMRSTMSNDSSGGRYIPPHLRRKESTWKMNTQTANFESSGSDAHSSDSDYSDGETFGKNNDHYRCSKARIAAIMCIKDLCCADPKLLTPLWPLLLPENDVLHPRKSQATLMTCLLFDPVTKVRVEAASTIALLLDGQASVLTQVAEYREVHKLGSFTSLSCSLGQILMQLHKGILFSLLRISDQALSIGVLEVLASLISATPYYRMPKELLPSVLKSVCNLITESCVKKENYATTIGGLSCLVCAFTKSPPSQDILDALEDKISEGAGPEQQVSAVNVLLDCIDREMNLGIRCEAFQALGAMIHNYPALACRIWKHVSSSVLELLLVGKFEYHLSFTDLGLVKGESMSTTTERCIVSGVKALDQCLRAVSGYKGADDHVEERLLDMPDFSDSIRKTRVSSAPSFALGANEASQICMVDNTSGLLQWSEVIQMVLPRALCHTSPMVRAAAVTCYAGITSAVLFALSADERDSVINSSVSVAVNDVGPSVRSAACRAIGVISCFPEVCFNRRVLNDFTQALEFNSHNSSVSVRIPAAWALANICDSLRYIASNSALDSASWTNSIISILVETAFRLTKDGDKVKSNAVRALGNISRFVRFIDQCDEKQSYFCGNPVWLDRMVQSFVSCVTTGNVKVQWNVCHALSNLFMNDTLDLAIMPWAQNVFSILLLLLRGATNYKIRIHAAVALAVPASRHDYGRSFSDVAQGLVHVLETLGANDSSSPSNFKYRASLEKQLAYTILHVLGFATLEDDLGLKQFLVKKATFLGEWLEDLCISLNSNEDQPTSSGTGNAGKPGESLSTYVPKKSMLLAAIKSLYHIYKSGNHPNLVQRFEMLAGNLR